MRCGVYVRVSTDDQRDNGYSIDLQLRMIKEYCEKNDYDIADIYNDAGHSGKDFLIVLTEFILPHKFYYGNSHTLKSKINTQKKTMISFHCLFTLITRCKLNLKFFNL